MVRAYICSAADGKRVKANRIRMVSSARRYHLKGSAFKINDLIVSDLMKCLMGVGIRWW